MSYCLYDPTNKQYLGDLASLGGWMDFRRWVESLTDCPLIVKNFVETGSTAKPQDLAKALHGMPRTTADVDSTRQQLANLAEHALNALVLSDGTSDAL